MQNIVCILEGYYVSQRRFMAFEILVRLVCGAILIVNLFKFLRYKFQEELRVVKNTLT